MVTEESLHTNKQLITPNEYTNHIVILIFTNQQISLKKDDLLPMENIFLTIPYYKKELEN